jgi:hypothetical protein
MILAMNDFSLSAVQVHWRLSQFFIQSALDKKGINLFVSAPGFCHFDVPYNVNGRKNTYHSYRGVAVMSSN